MPRPIVLTEEAKQKAIADFSEMLDSKKLPDGKLYYNASFQCEDKSAVVWLTSEAYRKILALVTGFSDEVGWHGTVSRVGDAEFIIEDIFVYPQEVTGSTVNTDQAAYTEWLYELDDDTFNKIRMQGHSHVNMGVSPSGVDDTHRQKILDQLEPDMFYIFMVWNKSLAVHTLIYDMAQNVLYEDADVEVKLVGDDGMVEFLADAKEKVQKSGYKKTHIEKSSPEKSWFGKGQHGKSKSGSKKQKIEKIERAERMGQLGLELDIDLDELEEMIQRGLDVDSEELAFYSRHGMHDIYDLGGSRWRL